jgi:hypothetical protein
VALVRAARVLAPQGAARLRRSLLVMRLRRRPALHGRLPLERLPGAFAAASSLLAQAMGAPAAHWAAALGASPAAAPRRAFALRRLHPMQRPRVARAWVDAATRCGLLRDHAPACDVLIAACRLLDTPPPQALSAPPRLP